MNKWLKLSHHAHSGRHRPHEHTSYGSLLVLLIVVGLVLTIGTVTAASPGPQAGSIGLAGEMPGKPPTVAATITKPSNGQHFGTSPVTVAGTCPAGTLVQIYKNDIFAGSTPCSNKGDFTIEIDLLIGQNILIARVYDSLNQPGPDSASVTVFYDALPPQASPLAKLNLGGTQMLLNTDSVFRGAFPGKEMTVPVTIIGGVPPYALNTQWGDSTNKVVPRNDNLTFKVAHTYQKPGTYQITLQATDSQGRVAFLSVAAIINGQPTVIPAATNSTRTNTILALWPFFTAALAAVVSFWLGERREKRILLRAGPAYHTHTA